MWQQSPNFLLCSLCLPQDLFKTPSHFHKCAQTLLGWITCQEEDPFLDQDTKPPSPQGLWKKAQLLFNPFFHNNNNNKSNVESLKKLLSLFGVVLSVPQAAREKTRQPFTIVFLWLCLRLFCLFPAQGLIFTKGGRSSTEK